MHAANAVLMIVGDEFAGGSGKDAGLMRGRMEGGIGHKVQRGFFGRGLYDGPDEAVRQQTEDVVNLLVVVRVFGHLLLLRVRVVEEFLDVGLLIGRGLLPAVLHQDAVHVALRGGSDPAKKLLLGLHGVLEVDPSRLVVFVLGALGVDDLPDDLLRGLRARQGEREGKGSEGEDVTVANHAIWMPEAAKGITEYSEYGSSVRGALLRGAAGLLHDCLCSLVERGVVWLLGEAGAVVIFLEVKALEEKNFAVNMNVNHRELP